MSSLQDKIRAKIAQSGRNMHEAKSGETLKEGTAFARLVGVVELGTQYDTFQGAEKETPKMTAYFELSGANWPVMDGKLPVRTIEFTNKDTSKSNLTKTLKRIDPDEKYAHLAEMIGQVFYAEVYHHKTAKGDVRAYIRNLERAVIKDPRKGEIDVSNEADPQIAKTMFFLWDMAELDEWDGLYLPGKYDDGAPRNVIQNQIRAAIDFVGSPIHALLSEDGNDPFEDIDPETGDPVPGSVEANHKAVRAMQDRQRGIKTVERDTPSENNSRRRR